MTHGSRGRNTLSGVAETLLSLLRLQGRGTGRHGSDPVPLRLDLPADPAVTYAIGDVHGCIDKLVALEGAIAKDAEAIEGLKLIVMLGDYVDRGPDSSRVLDHLIGPPPEGFYRLCLRGNHESEFLRFLRKPSDFRRWLDFGGGQTMRAYGFDIDHLVNTAGMKEGDVITNFVRTFPPAHRRFLEALPIAMSTPRFFFAHAGARPGVPLAEQSDRDLLWIRDSFLDHNGQPFEKTIIHGHTPQERPHVSPYRIGLDTGAYMGGPLTAGRLLGDMVRIISVQ